MSLAGIISNAIESLAASLPEAAGVFIYSGNRPDGRRVDMTVTAAKIETIASALLSMDEVPADVKTIKFYISKDGLDPQFVPQTGDTLTNSAGITYAVDSVEDKAASVWVLSTRQAT